MTQIRLLTVNLVTMPSTTRYNVKNSTEAKQQNEKMCLHNATISHLNEHQRMSQKNGLKCGIQQIQ